VRFTLARKVAYGQVHRVAGDHPALGGWDAASAPEMTWAEGDRWSAEIHVQPGATLEFKCLQHRSGEAGSGATWEGGRNHAVVIPDDGAEGMEVIVDWGGAVDVALPRESKRHDNNNNGGGGNGNGGEPEARVSGSGSDSSWPSSDGSMFSDDDVSLPAQRWAGREVVFMQSNDHSSERWGVWETAGLEGAALQLVEGDKDAGR
jgi:hypothetical protein